MASYMADHCFNRAADAVTSRSITVYIHSVLDPGNDGATGRIGTVQAVHPATEWTDAASGSSETNARSVFGVLDNDNAVTVRAYSTRDAQGFLGWATLDTPITVNAGESFALNAGTVKCTFRRPA